MIHQLVSEEKLGVVLTIVGGIHYGYNLALVAVVAQPLSAALGAEPSVQQTMLGVTMLGAVVGSPLSGLVAERSGRVPATILGETLSLLGTLAGALAASLAFFTAARFCVGVGIGICTMCKPLYVSETVPVERRGTILALFAPAIAVGILLAQSWPVALSVFSPEKPPLDGEVIPSYQYDEDLTPDAVADGSSWMWRAQLLTGVVPPAIILAVAFLIMPESQAWKDTQATLANKRERGASAPDASPLIQSLPDGALELLSSPGSGLAASFALVLAVAQQGTGVVAVVLFGSTILAAAAEATGAHLETWMALVVPAANFGGAIAGAALIDIIGRRRAYLIGLGIMTIAMLLPVILIMLVCAPRLEGTLQEQSPAAGGAKSGLDAGEVVLQATLVSMAAWAFFFEIGPGCGYFVVITEVTSPQLRPLAVTLGNTCRYVIELVLMFTFLSMWNSNVSAPLAILVSFALASSACFIFFYTQLIEIQGEDGPFDLSRNWRDVATSRGGDIESLPSESTAHAHDSYESAFPPDAAPSTPLRALKSLVNATTSARRSAVDSIRSFSFGSIPSFTASVVQYSPFRSSLSATLDEASSFPQPSPLTVDVVGASEMLASQAPPEIFKASSPAFLSPGRTTKSYMTYHIEARAPGSRRTHRCAQRFSSFDFFLAELTNGESLQIGSSAVHLSSAARSSIEGWRRRLLLERMAAVGDRSRDAAVVTARVELLRRLLHEVLAFDEIADADVTYRFIFGPGWKEGDPTSTM